MTWAKRFVSFIDACSKRVSRAWEAIRPPMRIEQVAGDLPSRLTRRKLYVVSEDGFDEQAAMVCPCGCKQVLHMNLLRDERPCWTVRVDDRKVPSLHPSVWRKKGCGSHFWLRRGRIVWC
jgi:hypothetical protein